MQWTSWLLLLHGRGGGDLDSSPLPSKANQIDRYRQAPSSTWVSCPTGGEEKRNFCLENSQEMEARTRYVGQKIIKKIKTRRSPNIHSNNGIKVISILSLSYNILNCVLGIQFTVGNIQEHRHVPPFLVFSALYV